VGQEFEDKMENMAPETSGLNQGLLLIGEAIKENTAVQAKCLEGADQAAASVADLIGKIHEQFVEINELEAAVESHKRVTQELIQTIGQQAELIQKLAEEKQNKPGIPG
jgi:chromosome segregation ATPase